MRGKTRSDDSFKKTASPRFWDVWPGFIRPVATQQTVTNLVRSGRKQR
jgi:hypothetical protein